MILHLVGLLGAVVALGTYWALLTGRLGATCRLCGALTLLSAALVGSSALSPINVGVLLMQAAFGAIGLHTLLRRKTT